MKNSFCRRETTGANHPSLALTNLQQCRPLLSQRPDIPVLAADGAPGKPIALRGRADCTHRLPVQITKAARLSNYRVHRGPTTNRILCSKSLPDDSAIVPNAITHAKWAPLRPNKTSCCDPLGPKPLVHTYDHSHSKLEFRHSQFLNHMGQ